LRPSLFGGRCCFRVVAICLEILPPILTRIDVCQIKPTDVQLALEQENKNAHIARLRLERVVRSARELVRATTSAESAEAPVESR
jgi:hypothetical protein